MSFSQRLYHHSSQSLSGASSSILEYGSITWHPRPLNKSLTNRLESCQRFACRVVLQPWNDSHEDHLLKSDLPLLSKRRDIATLRHLYKIVHNLCSSPNPYQPHSRPTLRNLNSFALDPPFCHLTLFQRSFYPYLGIPLIDCLFNIGFRLAVAECYKYNDIPGSSRSSK